MTSLYHSLNSSSFRMECDHQRVIPIRLLRWRRCVRKLVPAEETGRVDRVDGRVTTRTNFLPRRGWHRSRGRADRGWRKGSGGGGPGGAGGGGGPPFSC